MLVFLLPGIPGLVIFILYYNFFGNNEPGAVGTTRWWPPGIALQKRRFSKKDGKIMKN